MTRTSKIIITIIIAGLVIWAGYALFGFQEQAPSETIKIGVIAPLTGKGAARGESARQGLELALEKIEKQRILGDKKIELVFEDLPFGEAKNGPGIFNKLVDINRVIAIIGPMGSNESLSITSLVDEKRIPVIIHTASTLQATQDNEYVFRLWPTARNYVDTIFGRVESLDYKKIAAISTLRENTIDFLNVLKQRLDDSLTPRTLVIDERVEPEVKDFRTSILKIRNSDADTVFINLFEGQIGLFAKQADEALGLELPMFSNSVTSQVELDIAGDALEGVWYPRFAGYTDQARQEFIDKFGKEPLNPESAAAAHDGLLVLAEAISKVGTGGERIKNYLYENEFKGVIGKFRFMESGDAKVPMSIRVVRDGKIIELED